MSIHHNARGRSYAQCDVEGCDANVIDLSLRLDEADRVIRNFFGWSALPGVNRHECALHTPPREKRKRRTHYTRSWKREKEAT